MKRPLAVIGFSYVAVCMLAAALPTRVLVAVAIASGACAFLAFLSKHRARGYAVCVLLAVSCACTALLLAWTTRLAPSLEDAGKTLPLSGTVTNISGPRSIEVRRADKITVVVAAREALDVRLGETFSATVSYTRYEEGNHTPSAAAKARQTPLRGFVLGEYSVEGPKEGTLSAAMLSVRERCSDALLRYLPGESGSTLAAMLLGERWRVPQELRDVYADAGISHLLAISGYHVALLAGLLEFALNVIHLNKRLRLPIEAAVVIFYMLLVPFQPSIFRAGVMLLLMQLASLLLVEPDSLTSLAAAGLILCVRDPFTAAQLGFSLSFLATLGIVRFSQPLLNWIEERQGEARYPRARRFVMGTLCTTLCATSALLPVTLLQFDRIPLYAVLTNLAAAPLVPVMMASGLLTALFGTLPALEVLAVPLSFVAGFSTETLNAVARLIADLPFAAPPAGADFIQLWMLGAALLAAVACGKPSWRKTAVCALLCTITLMAGVLSYQLMMRGAVRLSIVATEHSAAVLAVKDRRAVLIGDIRTRADAYNVGRVMKKYAIDSLELVVLTPISGARNGEVYSLLEGYEVGMAVLGPEDWEDARMEVSLPGASICAWEEPFATSFLNGDSARMAGGAVFAEFEDIKTFLPSGECDILNSILEEGRPVVAVLGNARPNGVQRLRCDFLVDCGGSGLGPAARETVLLEEPGEEAAFLLKDGRVRCLDTQK